MSRDFRNRPLRKKFTPLSPKRKRTSTRYHYHNRLGAPATVRQIYTELAFLVAGLILSIALSQTVTVVVRAYKLQPYWHTIVVEVWFVVLLVLGAHFLPFRPKRYGLTLRGLRMNIAFGLLLGVIGGAAATLLRLKMIAAGHDELAYRFTGTAVLFTVTNIFTTTLQELVSKGVFQSGLRRIFAFSGMRTGPLAAIVLTATVFAQFHVVYGIWVTAAAFVYGLITGGIYEKTGSIIGISIMHFLIGLCMFHFSALA